MLVTLLGLSTCASVLVHSTFGGFGIQGTLRFHAGVHCMQYLMGHVFVFLAIANTSCGQRSLKDLCARPVQCAWIDDDYQSNIPWKS